MFNKYLGDCDLCHKPVYVGQAYEPGEYQIGVCHKGCEQYFAADNTIPVLAISTTQKDSLSGQLTY